jgi:hypothetical protein
MLAKNVPTSSPRSSSFVKEVTGKLCQVASGAVSGLATATSNILVPALLGSRNTSPKAQKDKKCKQDSSSPIKPSVHDAQPKVVVGTHVSPHKTKVPSTSQSYDIFSPHMGNTQSTHGMPPKEEVKVEPSAPRLPSTQAEYIHVNPVLNVSQPIPTGVDSKVLIPGGAGNGDGNGNVKTHTHVSTPYPHISQASTMPVYSLPPATRLEEQVASQLPHTSHVYVPPYAPTSIPLVLGGYTHSQYIPPLLQPSMLPYVPQVHSTHLPHNMGAYLAPALVASNGPQAPLPNPLTEAQLRLHNNSLQNDQHYVNPMHTAQENHFVNPVYGMQQPVYKAPLPETPPNLGQAKNVSRRQESIHSNLSPYSDQGLLGESSHTLCSTSWVPTI